MTESALRTADRLRSALAEPELKPKATNPEIVAWLRTKRAPPAPQRGELDTSEPIPLSTLLKIREAERRREIAARAAPRDYGAIRWAIVLLGMGAATVIPFAMGWLR